MAPGASMGAGSPSVRYQEVERVCEAVDVAPLLEAFGAMSSQQNDSLSASADTRTTTCAIGLGDWPTGAVATVTATVGQPDSGRVMFEGLRAVQEGRLGDVAGLGEGAYTYSDQMTGTHIVVYDNNLYLTIAVAPLRSGTAMPGDLPDRLKRVAQSVLSGLDA